MGHAGQRLDVVHGGRLAERPDHRGERRLEAREAALPLEGFQQRGLLAADVRTGAAVHPDVEIEPAAQDVVAEEPPLSRLLDRLLEDPRPADELPADVDVCGVGPDGIRGDRDPLYDLVWIVLDNLTVLERPGFGLVGVADEVPGAGVVLRHEAPLAPGGEARAAAASQLRVKDLLRDRVRRHREGLLQTLVPARGEVRRDCPRLGQAAGAQQDSFHSAPPRELVEDLVEACDVEVLVVVVVDLDHRGSGLADPFGIIRRLDIPLHHTDAEIPF